MKILKGEDVKFEVNLDHIDCATSLDLPPLDTIIGQDKALRALRLGVELKAPGYNIFVCGLSGMGKLWTIKSMLEELKLKGKIPNDRCYVYNFKNPDRPLLITIPAGKGRLFQKDMDEFIEILKKEVPRIFEDDTFKKNREFLINSYSNQQKKLFKDFEEKLKEDNFALGQVRIGLVTKPDILYLSGDKAYAVEQIENFIQSGEIALREGESVDKIRKKYEKYRKEFEELLRKNRNLSRKMEKEVSDLEKMTAFLLLKELIEDIKEKYKDTTVDEYLDQVMKAVLENLDIFMAEDSEGGSRKKGHPLDREDPFLQFRVNVVNDNSMSEGVPVIIETNPTYSNIFGTIEKTIDRYGHFTTDFTKIKGGSLLRADGGFLILNAFDALPELGVWRNLKRTLVYRRLEIQGIDGLYQLYSTAMKPEPIDIDVKVIMIGDYRLYHFLYAYEDEFKKIFKVRVDFDSTTDLTKDKLLSYCRFISKLCRDEGLKPFDKSGLSTIIEYGSRKAGTRDKLTTRLADIGDIARQACYYGVRDGAEVITREHVQKAIKAEIDRHNLFEEKIKEYIAKGTIILDIDGEKVGQVNGLSVIELGYYSFGRPNRITSTISVGKGGIINIEREAKLSGKTYDKAVFILSSYLRERFGSQRPLNLTASICFEQSYGLIEGDSASIAELYAILSSLSGLPLRQDIAVTGSMNQKGDVQPVGGINEKIEGFYDICKITRGITGKQGVIIPSRNVNSLILKDEIIEDIEKGRFTLYAIDKVEEGLEILTGKKAGEMDEKGQYPADTVYYLVDKKLTELAEKLRIAESGKKVKDEKEEEKNKDGENMNAGQ